MTGKSTSNRKARVRRQTATVRPSGDGRWRIWAVAAFFALAWVGLWVRAGYVQIVEGPWLAEQAKRQHLAADFERGERGEILDRDGRQLARSVRFNSVYVNPVEIENREAVVRALAKDLSQSPAEIRSKITTRRSFVWIARYVDDRAALAVSQEKLHGVYLTYEYGRLYPNNSLAGQVLGFVGVDGKGLDGVERSMDDSLAGGKAEFVVQRDAVGHRLYLDAQGREMDIDGHDVTLTIDAHIQDLAETALANVVTKYNARAGVCIVVDVPTGEILALANFPFFNPNIYRRQPLDVMRDRAAMDVYEPGSTMKPLMVAAALQERRVTPDTRYFCEDGKWKFLHHTIHDDIHSYGWLTVSDVIRYSSNIGAAKIGLDLGAPTYYKYLTKLGFGERPGLLLPGEGRGLLRPPGEWGEMGLANIAFGQGIGVTPLQLAKAYLCLADGGVLKPLRLVKDPPGPTEPGVRVFDEEVTRKVRQMMIGVVENAGTGVKAHIDGMVVGGKTGTAQKALPGGGYGKNYLSSFVGFIPGDKPKYLILAMVDDPSRVFYGSMVALPVVRQVAVGTLAYTCQLPGSADCPVDVAAKDADGSQVVAKVERPEAALADGKVPDVCGMPLRRAVEILARQGVVPKLEGHGAVVQKQSPSAGEDWPKKAPTFTLWLKSYAES
ncbi:penicillin-binding protein transpeptidase [Desulfovibrio sp. X2]|uniref:penicillin-binding transpeptidase domain-containing protein n=1 Tax=Desulfovibrio sp. X2 TaxID=941449 RepID=UPI000358A549|nr:penicillin-binding transpeptidase domain-containing protein [Desulfovibrio sp. X2]EPR44454.1 penicillin-binding protein transpeptidase [Desulfovibrio sp. X2]